MLLPKDPNDERNILLEIRAGTGGDEVLCSLATYCVCTPAMPNAIAGKSKSMSESPSELGGYKEVIVRRWFRRLLKTQI